MLMRATAAQITSVAGPAAGRGPLSSTRDAPTGARLNVAANFVWWAQRPQPLGRRFPIMSVVEDAANAATDSGNDAVQPTRPVADFLNEQEMIEKAGFPIKPDALIKKCRDLLVGLKFTEEENVDVENFTFSGPIVGPLDYKTFKTVVGGFNLPAAFPDLQECMHDFRVDPYNPARVWFTTRPYGINKGPFGGRPATGKLIDMPPETSSLTFNEEGKVIRFTTGYCMDKTLGNTGGLSAAFGMMYAIGRPNPFPEARPFKKSWQYRLFSFLARLTLVMRPKRKE